jgi:hypothetical protein
MNNDMTYEDVHVVDTFEEAEQFRYEHNDEPVEVGTAVGYDKLKWCSHTGKVLSVDLCCFKGVYFADDNLMITQTDMLPPRDV